MPARYNPKNRASALFIAFLCCALLLLFTTFFVVPQSADTPKKTDLAFGLDDEDVFLYLEAITRIREEALFLSPTPVRKEIVQDILKSYLTQKDAFSAYLTREEYRQFKKSQDENYVGIGMEIGKDQDGRIVCVPYPESPARKAGVAVGDHLKSIDGIPVAGKSLFAVSTLARGERGTDVTLGIATRDGLEKRIKVIRAEVTTESVVKRRVGDRPIIKIRAFTQTSKETLKRLLRNWETDHPIIIDLRGNAGGDFHAALDSAMLLLEKGKKVASMKTRSGAKIYQSAGGAINLTSPVYLWQDEATASAAEIFIAALTENDRAVSIGKKTFGKGTRQDLIELSDGSALVLTTGDLLTPRGVSYQGHGLNPTYMLKDVATDTIHYLMKVEELARFN